MKLRDPTHNGHGQVNIPKTTTFGVKCFVNPSLVPLYARAGPDLEFHATSPDTLQWLKSRLLSNCGFLHDDNDDHDDDLDICQCQCPVALLIRVGVPSTVTVARCIISDLLVYGVLSRTNTNTSETYFEERRRRLPTPPESSSSSPAAVGHRKSSSSFATAKKELKIYATPLSDSLVTKAVNLPLPSSQTTPDHHVRTTNPTNADAEFVTLLPDVHSPSPKRKRVTTLFEVAEQHHRGIRRKGGEAVSQVMSKSRPQVQTQQHSVQVPIKQEEPEESTGLSSILEEERIAASSSSSFRGSQRRVSSLGPNSRPGSSYGLASRASASASASFAKDGSGIGFEGGSMRRNDDAYGKTSSSLSSSNLHGDAETVITGNKNLITRTILTCMRLYGYTRTSSTSSKSTNKNGNGNVTSTTYRETPGIEEGDSTPAPGPGGTGTTEDEEFKAMYHATYRAATFALRKYLKELPTSGSVGMKKSADKSIAGEGNEGARRLAPLLKKEKATTLVDEILRLFCEN